MTSTFNFRTTAMAALAACTLLAGCVVQDTRPMTRIVAVKATAEVPQDELLDVAVRLFDPNVPQDPKQQEEEGIFPDVRNAESRYIPVTLRDTLEGTGQWGQARVLPREAYPAGLKLIHRAEAAWSELVEVRVEQFHQPATAGRTAETIDVD